MDLASLFDISPYDWKSIFTALFCGGVIGLERQVRGKPVGIRTASLITVGTYLFLATSFRFQAEIMDPSRVVGQVITGVGFLGAGVMMSRDGSVTGVTSAASIWVLAALGVVVASDHHLAAIKLSLLVVGILYGIEFLEKRFKALSGGVHATFRSSIERSRGRSRTGSKDGGAEG